MFFLLIILGACAGFCAGLLGVGGGFIVVPGLYFWALHMGYPAEHVMHMAVGSALAMIIPTGISAAFAHYRRNAIDFDLLKFWGISVFFGTIMGSALAAWIPGGALIGVFVIYLLMVGFYMALGRSRKAIPATQAYHTKTASGTVIGCISALLGIGGATLSVPLMQHMGIPMQRSVGTASALGLVIAVPGAFSYIISGYLEFGFLPFSIGYVNYAAVFCLVLASVPCAPLGAKLAHRLERHTLRRLFGVFMLLIAAKMAYEIF